MSEPEEADYDLVMPFATVASKGGPYDDQSYVAGYEMGHLDYRLADYACQYHEATVRSANTPQADLIAMRHGFAVNVHSDDGEWAMLTFTLADTAETTTEEKP